MPRYVLLKERNLLQTEKVRLRAQQKPLPNPYRIAKVRFLARHTHHAFLAALFDLYFQQVRKSMARIKVVLSERARAEESAERKNELLRFINAL